MFKTEPMAHQRADFERTSDSDSFAFFWEQGTGKTKISIDTIAHQFRTGRIDTAIVVAPNAVHRNWLSDELPLHLPEDVAAKTHAFSYLTSRAGTKMQKNEVEYALRFKGLALMTISYDAFMTEAGKKTVKDFIRRRGSIHMVLDEAHNIKTPGAKRTMSLIAAGRYATTKRILTGTPVANSPFDVYSQIRFLDQDFWKAHGIPTFQVFQHTFGIFAKNANGQDFPVGYRNLEVLKEWIRPISSRVLKEDVLDLPPKTYSRRYYELTPAQIKLYLQLKNEFIAELSNGDILDAQLAIVRLLRMQQVTCGYLPTEDGEEPVYMIDKKNPRIGLLLETLENYNHPVIIWARFRMDVDQICEALGNKCVRFDGKVSGDDRELARKRFKAGDVQYFVANPAVGGTGLTLTEAKSMVYYNNSFKLIDRLQSEDRFHRIGQTDPVSIIDLMAARTVDEHIASSLIKKRNVASEVTGDEIQSWL